MDQLTKWQKVIDDLNKLTLTETDNELFKFYREALKDIKKQASEFITYYDKLSFSKKLEAERIFDLGNKIKNILEETNKRVTDAVKDGTAAQLQQSYYGTFYALENAENINLPISVLDEKYIETVVNAPVDAKILSKRINNNTEQLAKKATQSLLQGAIDGKGYAYGAKRIEDETEASYKRALRIARTEGGRASSVATQRAYEEAKAEGVNLKKRWMATLDKKTRHGYMDGQTVDIEDDFVSRHGRGKGPRLMGFATDDINCRCTTITIVNGIEPSLRRDIVTNETIEYTTYKDWKSFKGIPDTPPA